MSFSDLVKSYGESSYGGIRNEERFEKWKHVYDNVNKLEKGKTTTFLYSAQHKDCIILTMILTLIHNSPTKIWRPFSEAVIDRSGSRDHDPNAIYMSASVSLLDWNPGESVNAFLIKGSESHTNNRACAKLLTGFPELNHIIRKYKLEERYLCVFAFTDSQLDRYVRLSTGSGELIDVPEKDTIKEIQQAYLDGGSFYYQNIQARILATSPESEDQYASYIFGPDGTLKDLYKELSDAILLGGKGLSKRKRSKRKRSKRKRRSKVKRNLFYQYIF